MSENEKLDGKKVVIGFTGRLDSIVAAYLLKKQGFDVHGVSILFAPREKEEGLMPLVDNKDQEMEIPFFCLNNLDQLEKVQEQANNLGISFYAVDASSEYLNKINDRVVASRLAGLSYTPEIDTHALIIEILVQKANLLQAKYVSTGHYAKLSSATVLSKVKLLTSNDIDNDQSGYLAKVNKSHFSRLKLPLADMRKNEVLKVASTLPVQILKEKVEWRKVIKDPRFVYFIQQRIPPSSLRPGQVIEYMADSYVCDHDGVHQFFHGESNLKKKLINSLESDFVIADIRYKDGTVTIMRKEYFKCESIIVSGLSLDQHTDVSRTINCYACQIDKKLKSQGRLSIKNNGYAQFDFTIPLNEVFSRGEFIVFLSHNKEGARVLGHGEITSFGQFESGKLKKLPKREDEMGEDYEEKSFTFAY